MYSLVALHVRVYPGAGVFQSPGNCQSAPKLFPHMGGVYDPFCGSGGFLIHSVENIWLGICRKPVFGFGHFLAFC